jgi:predicted enzyme related to lactoylglutathione lyase
MSKLQGKFVWFELVTRDAKKAQAFYGEVLGWKVTPFPMGPETYEMITAGEKTVGGYVRAEKKESPHWTSYVSVQDLDAAMTRVKAEGGKVLEAVIDVPTIGRMVKVADPTGAVFNLYQSANDDEPDAAKTPAGTFHWNELHTSDPARAVRFYRSALGYTVKDMDMGPMGTYHVLDQSGASRAGILKAQGEAPTMWLPYVAVDDADATAARAAKLGGKVVSPPEDIPDIGRFAILADGDGAVFAVIRPIYPA